MSRLIVLWTLSLAMMLLCEADIPCDEFHGKFCPEESGWDVGECLKKVEQDQLSAACIAYINMHDSCKAEIQARCNENAYTDYATSCLTEWMSATDLSPGCADAVPKKENKRKTMSDEDKRRAAKRRKTRNKAAEFARTFKGFDKEDDDGL